MSFTGLVAEIPIGTEGMTGSKNHSRIAPTRLLVAENITYENGTLQKEGGTTQYGGITGGPTIIGAYDWWPTPGTQRMVAVGDDGKIYKDAGSGDFPTTLKSGLLSITSETVPVFVAGGKEAAANNRKLFIFIPGNQVQVLSADGAATANIATPPADWVASFPTFGFTHDNRLMGGGNPNDPHRIYYTGISNHEDFTAGGSLTVYPGEGEAIVGAVSFKGLAVVFKRPSGIYVIDTNDPTPANWRVERMSRNVGLASARAIVNIDNDLLFVDPNGNFQLLSAVQEFGNLGSSSMSDAADMGPFIRSELNLGKTHLVRGVYYSAKREAHFLFTTVNATVPDARLVLDFNNPTLPRFRYSTGDTNTELFLRKDTNNIERPLYGDNFGIIFHMDQPTRTRDTLAYQAQFQCPHLDLSYLDPNLATVRKNGHFLEMVVEPKGNWNLNVDIFWDGVLHKTVTFNMGTTGAALGAFMLGTDALAGEQVLNKKRRITGGGRRFSLRGRNNGAGEDFSISRFFLHFTGGDERGAET